MQWRRTCGELVWQMVMLERGCKADDLLWQHLQEAGKGGRWEETFKHGLKFAAKRNENTLISKIRKNDEALAMIYRKKSEYWKSYECHIEWAARSRQHAGEWDKDGGEVHAVSNFSNFSHNKASSIEGRTLTTLFPKNMGQCVKYKWREYNNSTTIYLIENAQRQHIRC